MNEVKGTQGARRSAGRARRDSLSTDTVRAFHDRLDVPLPEGDDSEPLLAELRALEELKNAISARQARLTVAVREHQRSRDRARDLKSADTERLVGSQVALARRCSPHLGSRLLDLAHALVDQLPHTLSALQAGVITEWHATLIARETAGLARDQRIAVDELLRDDLGTVSQARLAALARQHAYHADPAAIVARRARAETGRRVTLRPAPDCIALLTALLPVTDGLACYAALTAAAGSDGTDRTRGQVMADTLTDRVTGRDAADHSPIGLQVELLMPLDTLTGDTPAHLPGYGPIPADLARELVLDADNTDDAGRPDNPAVDPGTSVGDPPHRPGRKDRLRIRRLFTYPGTGDLIDMESRSRAYPGLLAKLIRLRDQTCRTPWCDAPIAHIDHITPHTAGGPTSERNGTGLCARCNYAKEHPDLTVTGDAAETITTTGGLSATSRPPAPPGHPPPTTSRMERQLIELSRRWVAQVKAQESS
ncbi:HNH endonuclease [Flexivirga aerilata]|uniref:HNH endonuclease n=1 Tax=Flexivirga aerilata TaxID=1656889 RepID=UPI001BB298C7